MKIIYNLLDKLGLKSRDEVFLLEIRRKVGRMIIGAFLIMTAYYLHDNYGVEVVRNVGLAITSGVIISDYLRLGLKIKLPYLEPFVMRPYEKIGFFGSTLALVGCALTFYACDFDIAITAIAMYIFGDALAGLAGERFGKVKLFMKKSLQGSVTMFVISLALGMLLLKDYNLALFMAAFISVLELLIVEPADDLALPLYSAIGAQCFGAVFGARACLKGFFSGLLIFIFSVVIVLLFLQVFNFLKKVFKH